MSGVGQGNSQAQDFFSSPFPNSFNTFNTENDIADLISRTIDGNFIIEEFFLSFKCYD